MRHVISLTGRNLMSFGHSYYSIHRINGNAEIERDPFYTSDIVYSSSNPCWNNILLNNLYTKKYVNQIHINVWDAGLVPCKLFEIDINISELLYIEVDVWDIVFPYNSIVLNLVDGPYITPDTYKKIRNDLQYATLNSVLQFDTKLMFSTKNMIEMIEFSSKLEAYDNVFNTMRDKEEKRLQDKLFYNSRVREKNIKSERIAQLKLKLKRLNDDIESKNETFLTMKKKLSPRLETYRNSFVTILAMKVCY
eukprot:TRINITY_DN714_c0_g1_i5.p1 TRINITY_DN714_c0_g1~~TRINITY_DN714_c0_g1_i5.p1  ORF type:complete len:278 (+),score=40.12 TRINITY_DN714_c0_g1_i5:85-834(+)